MAAARFLNRVYVCILFSGTSSHVQILVLLLYLWELQGSNFAIWQPWERADIINMGVCESEKGKGGRNNEATFVSMTGRVRLSTKLRLR